MLKHDIYIRAECSLKVDEYLVLHDIMPNKKVANFLLGYDYY